MIKPQGYRLWRVARRAGLSLLQASIAGLIVLAMAAPPSRAEIIPEPPTFPQIVGSYGMIAGTDVNNGFQRHNISACMDVPHVGSSSGSALALSGVSSIMTYFARSWVGFSGGCQMPPNLTAAQKTAWRDAHPTRYGTDICQEYQRTLVYAIGQGMSYSDPAYEELTDRMSFIAETGEDFSGVSFWRCIGALAFYDGWVCPNVVPGTLRGGLSNQDKVRECVEDFVNAVRETLPPGWFDLTEERRFELAQTSRPVRAWLDLIERPMEEKTFSVAIQRALSTLQNLPILDCNQVPDDPTQAENVRRERERELADAIQRAEELQRQFDEALAAARGTAFALTGTESASSGGMSTLTSGFALTDGEGETVQCPCEDCGR